MDEDGNGPEQGRPGDGLGGDAVPGERACEANDVGTWKARTGTRIREADLQILRRVHTGLGPARESADLVWAELGRAGAERELEGWWESGISALLDYDAGPFTIVVEVIHGGSAGAVVQGQVLHEYEEEFTGARIVLDPSAGTARVEILSPSGEFRVGGLDPGDYRVTILTAVGRVVINSLTVV